MVHALGKVICWKLILILKRQKMAFSSVLFPWNHNALCGKHLWFSDGCGYGCVGATVMHLCTLKYSSHFRFINVYMDMDTGCT
jgi:hypothetical protein